MAANGESRHFQSSFGNSFSREPVSSLMALPHIQAVVFETSSLGNKYPIAERFSEHKYRLRPNTVYSLYCEALKRSIECVNS